MGWALPIDQWAIEPLYDGCGGVGRPPQAFGIYRRNRYGWYRVTQKTSREAAEVKLGHLKAKDYVQTSSTT